MWASAALSQPAPVPPAVPPAPAAPRPVEPRWRLSLALAALYDSNVAYEPGADPQGDAAGSATLGLLGRVQRPRHGFDLRTRASGLKYLEATRFDKVLYGGELDLFWLPDSHTRLDLSQAFRQDYGRNIAALSDAGLVQGQNLTRYYDGRLGASRQVRPRLDLVGRAAWEHVGYSDEAFPAGSTLRADAGLDWGFGEGQRAGLRYAYVASRSGERDSRTHEGLAVYGRELGDNHRAELRAGLGSVRPLGGQETLVTWSLQGRLQGRYGRHRLSADYRHGADQAYGFARTLLFDTVSAGDSWALAPRLGLDLRGSWSRGREPGGGPYQLDSQGASAGLAWRAARRVRVVAGWSYLRSQDGDTPEISSHSLRLSIVHERAWR